jgi:hypothetical protein
VADGISVAVAESAGVKVGTGAVEVGASVAALPQLVINNTTTIKTDSFFM